MTPEPLIAGLLQAKDDLIRDKDIAVRWLRGEIEWLDAELAETERFITELMAESSQ